MAVNLKGRSFESSSGFTVEGFVTSIFHSGENWCSVPNGLMARTIYEIQNISDNNI